MKKIGSWALIFLGMAVIILAFVFWNSTNKATAAVQEATDKTDNLNKVAGRVDKLLADLENL